MVTAGDLAFVATLRASQESLRRIMVRSVCQSYRQGAHEDWDGAGSAYARAHAMYDMIESGRIIIRTYEGTS